MEKVLQQGAQKSDLLLNNQKARQFPVGFWLD